MSSCKLFITSFFVFAGLIHSATAQTITGSTSINAATTSNYSYFDPGLDVYFVTNPVWTIVPSTSGTVLSSSVSADRYTAYVTVQWNVMGPATLKLLRTATSTNPIQTLAVTVNCAIPSIPTNLLVGDGGETICVSGSIRLAAVAGANANTLRWYANPSDITPFLQGSTSYTTPAISSSTTYYISSFNTTTACESSKIPITAPVSPKPSIPVSAIGAMNCASASGSVVLTAAPGAGGDQIVWSYAGLQFTGNSYATPIFSGLRTYEARTLNSSAQCASDPVLVTAFVGVAPSATISGGGTSCGGASLPTVTFTFSGTAPFTFTYSNGTTPTTISNYNATLYSIANASAGTYSIISLTGSGCAATSLGSPVSVVVRPAPVIYHNGGGLACPGGTLPTVQFSFAGVAAPFSFKYSYSTGSVAPNTITVNSYSATTYSVPSVQIGNYALISVTDAYGCVTSNPNYDSPAQVAYGALPTGSVAGGGTVCSGATLPTVTFNFTGTPPFTFSYSNGVSIATVTNHNATSYNLANAAPGTYSITALTNNINCAATNFGSAAVVAVNTVSPPTYVIESLLCGPSGNAFINAFVGAGGSQIKWYDNASTGTPLVTAVNYTTPTLSAPTTYWIATYNPSLFCESARVAVLVDPTVPAAPSVSSTTLCGPGLIATLTSTPGANASNTLWYSSPVDGAVVFSGNTFATAKLNTTSYYYAASHNLTTGCTSSVRTPVTVAVADIPKLVAYEDYFVYGSGPANLRVTPRGTAALEVNWYATSAATASLGTGLTYTSPVLSANISYYVKLRDLATNCMGGPYEVPVAIVPFVSPASLQTDVVRVAGKKDDASLAALTDAQKSTVFSYIDGMGRATQKVILRGSPLGKDVVQPVDYDANGRTSKDYMPYVATTADGTFHSAYYAELLSFYQLANDKVADDTAPYAVSSYEASPLGRKLEQGTAGLAWQPGTGHTSRTAYSYNTGATLSEAEEVRKFNTDGTSSGFYSANVLARTEATDENGNKEIIFTDPEGHVVARKEQLDATISAVMVSYLETYYIYDDLGQLKYMVQPKGVAALKTTAWAWTQALKDSYVFEYAYDQRGRLIGTRVPVQGWSYTVYDQLNRPVLVQDANLRPANQWAFLKYDSKGRTVQTGIYTDAVNTTRTALQSILDAKNYDATDKYYEVRQAATTYGYSNQAFPTTGTQLLTVGYHDDYDFNMDGTADFAYVAQGLSGEDVQGSAYGLPTGSKRLILGTTTWLTNYVFYNGYGRAIQARSNNHLSPTVDNLSTTVYDFEGKVLLQKTYHNAGGTNQVTVLKRPVYDFAGRTLKMYQQVNATPEVLVAQYDYNEVGQVVDKKLHSTNGTTFLQSVDYRYNIKGWLTSVNNAQLAVNGTNDDTNDYFGMELYYNTAESTSLGNPLYYNGNVGAIKWKNAGVAAGVGDQRSYSFTYDKTDKLKTSAFKGYNGSVWGKENGTLNENMNYDHNGNITTLSRNQNVRGLSGTVITSTAQGMDNLGYSYINGNQLNQVSDAAPGAGGFVDGASSITEFAYNANGSLTKDLNKGITSITYNALGKPLVVTFSGTPAKTVTYTYDAVGTKLKMVALANSVTTTTDYVGGFVYTNNALNFFGSPEGRVVKNGTTYEYQYAIADHQGNTRVVFSSVAPTPTVLTATFEGDANDNSSQFTNVLNVVPYGSANNTPAGVKVVRMNQTYSAGPAKSLKVYPGDKIDMETYAYYEGTSGFGGTNNTVAAMVTSIASAFGGVSGGTGESGSIFNGINSALSGIGLGPNQGDTKPSAYLNYILFDQQYKVLNMGWTAVPSTANFAKQKISIPQVAVQQAGYMFVYLSYETASNNWVYFDDFKVTHTKGNLVQGNEYYPYGLQTANSWTRENSSNNFLYNDGSEANATTGLYDLPFRNYDAALGRFHQVDPLSDQTHNLTPYAYADNNPANLNDPSGLKATWEDGGIVGDKAWLDRQAEAAGNFDLAVSWAMEMGARRGGIGGGGSGGDGGVTFYGSDAAAFIRALQNGGGVDVSNGSFWCEYCGSFAKSENGKDYYNGAFIYASQIQQLLTQGGATDPLKDAHGHPVYTLEQFLEANKGKSFNEIINQRKVRNGMAGGPEMRMVQNPRDGNIMDMRHVMVVGYQYGRVGGYLFEITQWVRGIAQAFNGQDLYSNAIGDDFNFYSFSKVQDDLGRPLTNWKATDWSKDFYDWMNRPK
jgi:RHS repeat-associated protein